MKWLTCFSRNVIFSRKSQKNAVSTGHCMKTQWGWTLALCWSDDTALKQAGLRFLGTALPNLGADGNSRPKADAGLAGFEGIHEARQPHQGFNTKRVKNAKEARRPLSFNAL
jgi:hypothetical protein